ncbi:hypothetical protein DSM21852_13870 [Methylocystis bryophila]|nr:hypothetical protein DSM21852_13870 [Methylocystis bryophila]
MRSLVNPQREKRACRIPIGAALDGKTRQLDAPLLNQFAASITGDAHGSAFDDDALAEALLSAHEKAQAGEA